MLPLLLSPVGTGPGGKKKEEEEKEETNWKMMAEEAENWVDNKVFSTPFYGRSRIRKKENKALGCSKHSIYIWFLFTIYSLWLQRAKRLDYNVLHFFGLLASTQAFLSSIVLWVICDRSNSIKMTQFGGGFRDSSQHLSFPVIFVIIVIKKTHNNSSSSIALNQEIIQAPQQKGKFSLIIILGCLLVHFCYT